MRTTIDLPDELFREAKIRAVQQGTTLKNLMTQLVRSGLESPVSGADGSPGRRNPPPVAIRRIPGKFSTPAWTNRQLHELLDEQEVRAARDASTALNDGP